jgi:hypothetical protein
VNTPRRGGPYCVRRVRLLAGGKGAQDRVVGAEILVAKGGDLVPRFFIAEGATREEFQRGAWIPLAEL